MTKAVEAGFAFHVHHDILMEFCWDYDLRVTEIKRNKPKNERKLRLRLLQRVPDTRLPLALVRAKDACIEAEAASNKARDACIKAEDAYKKARDAYSKTARDARNKAYDASVKAMDAYNKAKDACIKAMDTYKPEMEKLHQELCPNCPWDGKTIFPEVA